MREGEKNKEIIEHIKEARAFGDLSENAEYDAAKEEQAKNAARIAEIQSILANARDAGDADHNLMVSIGCTVSLVDGDGVATDVTLVGTTETNSWSTRSPTSPRSAAPSSATVPATRSRSSCPPARPACTPSPRSRARPRSRAQRIARSLGPPGLRERF